MATSTFRSVFTMDTTGKLGRDDSRLLSYSARLLKTTFRHWLEDISIVTLLFAMIFKFPPDARLSWRDVRLGAALTAVLFLVGKYALGLYLAAAQLDPLTAQPVR